MCELLNQMGTFFSFSFSFFVTKGLVDFCVENCFRNSWICMHVVLVHACNLWLWMRSIAQIGTLFSLESKVRPGLRH